MKNFSTPTVGGIVLLVSMYEMKVSKSLPRINSLFLAILTLMLVGVDAQEIVAHRGASHDAPENTLAAFHLAWEQNADAIEGDFMLTKDNVIVCVHDEDLERIANQKLKVVDITYAELKDFDVGSWKHPRFANQRIPTLAQVLGTVPEGKKVFIEIKCGPEIIPPLRKVIDECPLTHSQLVIISFDENVIAGCRKTFPSLKAHWLTGFKQNQRTQKWNPSLDSIMATLRRTRATGLDCKAESKVIKPAIVARLREQGLEFHCWTVNDIALARRFQNLGVDSITTDRPGWLRERLGLEKGE